MSNKNYNPTQGSAITHFENIKNSIDKIYGEGNPATTPLLSNIAVIFWNWKTEQWRKVNHTLSRKHFLALGTILHKHNASDAIIAAVADYCEQNNPQFKRSAFIRHAKSGVKPPRKGRRAVVVQQLPPALPPAPTGAQVAQNIASAPQLAGLPPIAAMTASSAPALPPLPQQPQAASYIVLVRRQNGVEYNAGTASSEAEAQAIADAATANKGGSASIIPIAA